MIDHEWLEKLTYRNALIEAQGKIKKLEEQLQKAQEEREKVLSCFGYMQKKIEALQADKAEAVNALISSTLRCQQADEFYHIGLEYRLQAKLNIKVLETLTGKKWEEVRG